MTGPDHDWQIIIALGVALNGLAVGVIRYLLAQVDRLTKANEKMNDQNAILANLWVEAQKDKWGRR